MRRAVFALALLVGGMQVAALALVVANAPAFRADLRRETPLGDWRILPGSDLFDRASYDFRVGYEYLQADAYAVTLSGADEIASAETARIYTQRAVDALSDSVAENPSDARAWLAYGWALFDAEDLDATRRAIEASWALAPHSVLMSLERLLLAELVAEDLGVEMPEPWIDPVVADLSLAQERLGQQFGAMMIVSERMSAIADRAGLLDPPDGDGADGEREDGEREDGQTGNDPATDAPTDAPRETEDADRG